MMAACNRPGSASEASPSQLTAAWVVCLQDCFEVGRRFKIMNPDRMRSDYGKLMYLLMDAADPDVQELLEFNCIGSLRTGEPPAVSHCLH